MVIMVVEFIFTSSGNGKLPSFKGSTLRGAFGRALQRQSCLKNTNCDSICELASGCLFARLFGFEKNRTAETQIPRPYILRSSDLKTDFEPGSILCCEMIVFGIATDKIKELIDAMIAGAQTGLGVQRLRFNCKSISGVENLSKGSDFWDNVMRRTKKFEIHPPRNLILEEKTAAMFEIVTPFFISSMVPGKIKINGAQFLRAFIRRVSQLSFFWGNDDWAGFPFGDYFKLFKNVAAFEENLTWCESSRYSKTQQKEFPVRGLTGRFFLQNIPVPMTECLSLLDHIHVGKGAAWGLGEVKAVGFFAY